MNIKDMEKEIQTTLKDLVSSAEGATLEGKARAMTIASDYLFEFWKRAAGNLPAKKARVKAMEAMHRKLMTQEKEEDLKQLAIDIKEAQNVFNTEDKGELASTVSAGEAHAGTMEGARRSLGQNGTGEGSEGDSDSDVVHPQTPEGHSTSERLDAADPQLANGAPEGEVPTRKRPEPPPLTILPADSPLGLSGDGGTPDRPNSGREESNGVRNRDDQHKRVGASDEAGEGRVRRGWKDSTAKGRKDRGGGVLSVQPDVPASDGRRPQVLPAVLEETGLERRAEGVGGEEMKNFRDMDNEELTEKIEQVQRSRADAMEGFSEDIQEVKNVRVGRGDFGARNMSLLVGKKRCINCQFELPGYETLCVACKTPQPKVVKP